MPFRGPLLLQGLAVAAAADLILLALMPRILQWHSVAVGMLLRMASVPWQTGLAITVFPGISAALPRTQYLDYAAHPLYPILCTGLTLTCFLAAFRYLPAPLKPLLLLVPASLAMTFLFFRFISPAAPYSPEAFCAIWYRGETYLWLLLPLIFTMSFFVLNVPFSLKIRWLAFMQGYAFLWSAVRLAFALATFHYFGSIWMPLFYFAFGFLADFLYIVATYSLAMDRAAIFLARQKEVWQ